MSQWFEEKVNLSGDECRRYMTLREQAPAWVRDAVYAAHDGMLPNDWVYAECAAAFDLPPEQWDEPHEYIDSRVEIYTKAVFQWAADMCGTSLFSSAEETYEESGPFKANTEQRIQGIQYYAIESIVNTIIEARRTNEL